MNLVDKAIQVAAIAHSGQHRKGTHTPYIVHVYAVGMILARHGCSEEVIAAGILHDTIEDTQLELEDLEREFGANVTVIVKGCTEPDKRLSWEERKEHTIEELKHASDNVRFVTCADKLHNVRSMRKDYETLGELLWTKFKRGKEQQARYYRGIIDSLSVGSSFAILDELKVDVVRLFGSTIELPRNLRGRSIHINIIPTVCNVKNMIEKLIEVQGNEMKLKPWEQRSFKAYRFSEIKHTVMKASPEERIQIIREHILSGDPNDFGASCIDIYLVGYVASTFGSGKEKFFQYIHNEGISDKPNTAQAIWQVGKGDGVYLNILNEDGTVRDWEFMRSWLGMKKENYQNTNID